MQSKEPVEDQRQGYPEDNPCHHTIKLRGMLKEVADHAGQDIGKVEEPGAQALFETTAQVLQGLITAFEHYELRSEAAGKQ